MLPKHFYSPIYSWNCITPGGGGGHVSNAAVVSLPRIRSTPSIASKYASFTTHACCTLAHGLPKLHLQPQEFCLQESENPKSDSSPSGGSVKTKGAPLCTCGTFGSGWAARTDNRFLSVFRWIKLTKDQAQPNIALAWLLVTSDFNTW